MRYVLEGLEHGLCAGFAHGSTLHAAPSNMQSARLHPAAISSYLSKEVDGRRMSGPFLPGQIPGLHINRMGVVLKGQHPWPMETDHRSVQHGGWKRKRWYRGPACSLKYTSVESQPNGWAEVHPWLLSGTPRLCTAGAIIPATPTSGSERG